MFLNKYEINFKLQSNLDLKGIHVTFNVIMFINKLYIIIMIKIIIIH